MRIFVSFASEQSRLAEGIYRKLLAAGYDVFFASDSIRASNEYDERIREEVAKADRLIFLASRDSLADGRYTLTEIEMFKRRWPDPTGVVMTVLADDLEHDMLPPYLGAVTSAFRPQGDTAAEVAALVVDQWPRKRRGSRRRWVGSIAVLALAAFVAWRLIPESSAVRASDDKDNVVAVTLIEFLVHADGDILADGDGEIYWSLVVNGTILAQQQREDPVRMAAGDRRVLNVSKEFRLGERGELRLSGFIGDWDSKTSGDDDKIPFDALLTVPATSANPRQSLRPHQGRDPDIELFFSVTPVR